MYAGYRKKIKVIEKTGEMVKKSESGIKINYSLEYAVSVGYLKAGVEVESHC